MTSKKVTAWSFKSKVIIDLPKCVIDAGGFLSFKKINDFPEFSILTPHIGGATHEAQDSIGIDVAQKLIKYNTIGDTEECVNLPQIIANNILEKGTPKYIKICCIHLNKSGVLSKINAIFNNHNINIIKQYLSTMDTVGYCITEINNCIGIKTLNVLKTEIEYLKENIRTFIH